MRTDPRVLEATAQLERAHRLLQPFSAADALSSSLFDQGADPLLLSAEGRRVAAELRDELAPAAEAAREASSEFSLEEEDLQGIVDGAQLALQLIVAGIAGALCGPLPSGEVLHSVHRLAEGQADALRIRIGQLPVAS